MPEQKPNSGKKNPLHEGRTMPKVLTIKPKTTKNDKNGNGKNKNDG